MFIGKETILIIIVFILKGEIMENFEEIIGFSIVAIIVILILGAIVSAIFHPTGNGDINANAFFSVFVIIVAIGGIMISNIKEAGIFGAITGILVGLFQNHVLSFVWGVPVYGIEFVMGNPTFLYLVVGIIVAAIANTIFGKVGSS